MMLLSLSSNKVVPYIGTWIETPLQAYSEGKSLVVPYIGTWIETSVAKTQRSLCLRRTLYRYVD